MLCKNTKIALPAKFVTVVNRCAMWQADAGTSLFAILESAKTPPDKLQSFCEEFINQDPRVVWPWQCLWRVHSATGEHQKAMASMHVVLRAHPTDAGVWEKLATTYQKMGRATAALKVCAIDSLLIKRVSFTRNGTADDGVPVCSSRAIDSITWTSVLHVARP